MSEKNQVNSRNIQNAIMLIAAVAFLVYFIVNNLKTSASILLALIGLGVVIFIHELGHFIAGKLSDIKVEAFAIGFGPILLGIKMCPAGLRVRILPTLFQKYGDEEDTGLLAFTIPGKGKQGETEYQIRLVPVGGFVKLLGQEDTAADKPSDDPRSFVNKPIWKRVFVGVAGVTMNVILAVILFIAVYTIGIKFPPAVIGYVTQGFPAAEARLQPGDEIIEINGKSNLNFTDIGMAGALSGKGEPVPMKVKRRNGVVESISLIAEPLPGVGFRGFGIMPAGTLEIAQVADPNKLYEKMGLIPGDRLVAVGDLPIEKFWEYDEAVENTFAPSINLTFERKDSLEPIIVQAQLEFSHSYHYKDQNDLSPACVYGLVPRLKIASVKLAEIRDVLMAGDVILKAVDVDNPSYKQLREITEANVGKNMAMSVLRGDKIVDVNVMPILDEDGRGVIGVGVGLDLDHPVVSFVADVNSLEKANIPHGSQIVAIAGKSVANYFDIATALDNYKGKNVKIVFKHSNRQSTVDFPVPATGNFIRAKSYVAENIPFKILRKLYQAPGPIQAAAMGCRKTVTFIMQTYMTIKGLILNEISPKSLMGPVGMISASSKIIAEKEFLQYVHFMAIISACLAVMNFLPLPILDGGLVVLLIIEKLKGSPVNIKAQEVITYIGLALIGALFVMITYNDIVRLIKEAFSG